MLLDLKAADNEFVMVPYEEGTELDPPAGDGWRAVSFAASQSLGEDGKVDRCGWILWVRAKPANGAS